MSRQTHANIGAPGRSNNATSPPSCSIVAWVSNQQADPQPLGLGRYRYAASKAADFGLHPAPVEHMQLNPFIVDGCGQLISAADTSAALFSRFCSAFSSPL